MVVFVVVVVVLVAAVAVVVLVFCSLLVLCLGAGVDVGGDGGGGVVSDGGGGTVLVSVGVGLGVRGWLLVCGQAKGEYSGQKCWQVRWNCWNIIFDVEWNNIKSRLIYLNHSSNYFHKFLCQHIRIN